MTVATLCIVIAIFIPLACTTYAKLSRKGYDNRSPREFMDKLEGKGRRANYAQMNSFEAFAPFAVGVVVAHQLQASQPTIDALAMTFIAARILYVIFYIQDRHVLRTLAWSAGFFSTIALYFIGA